MTDTYMVDEVNLVAAAKDAILLNSQPQIDQLKTTLENIISNTDQVALNSLAELAASLTTNGTLLAAINSISGTNLTKINALTASITAEITRAKGKESQLSSDVTTKIQALLSSLETASTQRVNEDVAINSTITTKHNQAINAINTKGNELQAVDTSISNNVATLQSADVAANNEIASIKAHEISQNETLYHTLKSVSPTSFVADSNDDSGSDDSADPEEPAPESINYAWTNGIEGLYHGADAPATPEGYARFADAGNNYVAFLSISDKTGSWSTTQIMDKLANQGVDINIHKAPSEDLIAFINSYNMVTSSTFSDSKTYTKEAIEAGDVSYDNIVTISSHNTNRLVLEAHNRVDNTFAYNIGLRTVYTEVPINAEDRSTVEVLPMFHNGIKGLYLAENVPSNAYFLGYSKFTDSNGLYVVFMETSASDNAYTSAEVTDSVKSTLGFNQDKVIPDHALIRFMMDNNMTTTTNLSSTVVDLFPARDWTNEALHVGQVNPNNGGMVNPDDTSRLIISNEPAGYANARLRGVYADATLSSSDFVSLTPSTPPEDNTPEVEQVAQNEYVTKEYAPGYFITIATGITAQSFAITGNLGADGSGSVAGGELVTSNGSYKVFYTLTGGAVDPSINHIVIVTNNASASHTFDTNTNNENHVVTLGDSSELYYLLAAQAGGGGIPLTVDQVTNVANTFVSNYLGTITTSAILAALDGDNAQSLIDLLNNPHDIVVDQPSGERIDDGGNDMYDGGNIIRITKTNNAGVATLPYTNGVVTSGDSYFV